ncbi:MAG: class I SAM-dependent methyltransferase [Patescibacteria group bacterium]|jgi:predicted O-methyltransferase YrrM
MSAADQVLQDIEKRSKWEFLPIIGSEKGALIEQLLAAKKPCLAVDIGAMVGYATVLIANRLSPGCRVIGLEISNELADRAEENIRRAEVADRASIIRGDARVGLKQIAGPIDLVLLDAQKSQYLGCLKKLESRLSPGAVIIANGTSSFHKEVRGYLDYVKSSAAYESSSHVFGADAMEVSIFKG